MNTPNLIAAVASLALALNLLLPAKGIAQNHRGDTWAQAKAAGKGKIAYTFVETPSLVYRDPAGRITGICVDIMADFTHWVAQNKKVQLDVQWVGDGSSFRTMYDQTRGATGGVFGLGNITITEERKKEVKFSPPFITNFAILVTHNNVPTLGRLEDMPTVFSKLTAYAARGTTNEQRLLSLKQKYFPALPITATATSQETLERIVADPNGLAYLDITFYLEAVRTKKSLKRHPVADQAAEQFGFIMPQNSDWYALMDEFFKAGGGYLNSASYRAILVKHLGETGVKLLQSAN